MLVLRRFDVRRGSARKWFLRFRDWTRLGSLWHPVRCERKHPHERHRESCVLVRRKPDLVTRLYCDLIVELQVLRRKELRKLAECFSVRLVVTDCGRNDLQQRQPMQ